MNNQTLKPTEEDSPIAPNFKTLRLARNVDKENFVYQGLSTKLFQQ